MDAFSETMPQGYVDLLAKRQPDRHPIHHLFQNQLLWELVLACQRIRVVDESSARWLKIRPPHFQDEWSDRHTTSAVTAAELCLSRHSLALYPAGCAS